MTARPKPPPIEAAVKREIADLSKRSPGAEKSALAALSLRLAREIEGDENLAARVTAAKVLLDAIDQLRAIAPAAQQKDRLDDLAARRSVRKAAAS